MSLNNDVEFVPEYNKKSVWHKIVGVIGLSNLFGGTAVMYITFWMAKTTENKSVLVKINDYGEAVLEFWILLFMIPFTLYVFWQACKRIFE